MSSNYALEFLDNEMIEEKVQEIIAKKEWMHKKKFVLIDTIAELDKFVAEAAEVGECVVDFETNGLNVGPVGRGVEIIKMAGVCLSFHEDYGVYVPVAHREGRNLPLDVVVTRLRQIIAACVTIYHNFKFDGEILRNHGIFIEDPDKYHDTMLMIAVLESDRKDKGLKGLSDEKLGQEQIELKQLLPGKDHVDFTTIHPKEAVWYGASDGVCTMGLYHWCRDKLLELDPQKKNGMHFIYNVERACQLVVMEMERNLVKVDVKYYSGLFHKVGDRLKELEDEIFKAAGEVFDINSIPQLGRILFEKFAIPYPSDEKSKTGQYTVKDEILEKIKNKHPLPRMIQEFRELGKLHTTYLGNLVKNVDKNDCVKFQLNQVTADSGRFSSKGGKGLHHDGYSGVNCQNIPAGSDEDPWKLRKGIIARPGYVICSIDYSGEELRIAANFSREPVWIKEFNEGEGDLHSITASLLFGGATPAEYAVRKDLKPLRKIAKIVNFLILYGGGASKLAEQAKITMQDATERLEKFFAALDKLSEWMKVERMRARKRGYSLTAFGRRRPLAEMYASGDRGLISKADRLACNAAIQGTGADVIKIAMYRVWCYIRKNNLQDDIRMMFPIHDEIVYEIKEDKLDTLIPALCQVMKIDDLTQNILKWPVKLEVDAEYGENFLVKNNYYEDLKKGITPSMKLGAKKEASPSEEPEDTETGTEEVLKETVEAPAAEEIEQMLKEGGEAINELASQNPSNYKLSTSEYFGYEVAKSDAIAKAHADVIWCVLESMEAYVTGPRKRIRLTKGGKIIHTTSKAYSVDGFIALARNYEI